NWIFTAVDPSATMLEQAQKNIGLGLEWQRIRFIQTDTQSLNQDNQFDSTLAMFVAHVIPSENKAEFFQDISDSLKTDGVLLTYDLMQPENETALKIL